MSATESQLMKKLNLQTAVRNRYFYMKLLDVYHFELETNYLNDKRWLLNRLVFGYGVVCGLDVKCGPDDNTIIVTQVLPLISGAARSSYREKPLRSQFLLICFRHHLTKSLEAATKTRRRV